MKTYKKIIEAPRLKIRYDETCESPRQDTNIGYFVTIDRNYNSPDNNETIESIIRETGGEVRDVQEHMDAIKKGIKEATGEKVVYISPVVKYEHSSISYSLGTARGFDYSNNGFYIVTDKTLAEVGVKEKDIEKQIKAELETYSKYANGNVYAFTLYTLDGEIEDSCGGFYDIEDMRGHLPEDFKDEKLSDYLN